jgi:hypothetical protein
MKIIAIDPGTKDSGGMATLIGDALFLDRIPYDGDELNYEMITSIFDSFEPDIAIIEKPFVMSGNRNRGITTQLTTYGELLAICKLHCREVKIVAPSTWKAKLKLKSDKEQSVKMAMDLFPSHSFKRTARCKGPDHNLAEAALLAYYVTLLF